MPVTGAGLISRTPQHRTHEARTDGAGTGLRGVTSTVAHGGGKRSGCQGCGVERCAGHASGACSVKRWRRRGPRSLFDTTRQIGLVRAEVSGLSFRLFQHNAVPLPHRLEDLG